MSQPEPSTLPRRTDALPVQPVYQFVAAAASAQDNEPGHLRHDIRRYAVMLRRRAATVGAIVAIGTLLAVLYALKLPNIYLATATVVVEPRQTNVVESQAVLSGIGADNTAIDTEVLVIRSKPVAERVVDKLGLKARYAELDDQGSALGRLFGLLFGGKGDTAADPLGADAAKDNALSKLERGLVVSRLGSTYAIGVGFRSVDPAHSAEVANAFADSYLVDQLESKYDATRRANDWLNERVVELRSRVRAAEAAVGEFRAANNLVEADGHNLNDQQVTKLNEQLILARAQTAEARSKLEQLNRTITAGGEVSSFADTSQSQVITQLRARHSEVRRQLADLNSRYGGRHPSVINMRAQLGDIRSQIEIEIDRIKAITENAYRVARSREESIASSLAGLKGDNARYGQAEIRLRELQREADATRALFESFLGRFKETSEQESLQTPDSRIVEWAARPERPDAPNRKAIVVLGFLVSLGAGVGVALLLEIMDSGFRAGRELEEATSVPLLASLPIVELGGASASVAVNLLDRLRAQLPRRWRGESLARSRQSALRARTSALVQDQPLSSYTEEIRSMRMGLRYRDLDDPAKVVMVTSALPSEGKSTVASNLALHAAASGESVLLIDLDLRHPALSQIYAGGGKNGLVQYLAGNASLPSIMRVHRKTGLKILPSVRTADLTHTAEILGSKKLRGLIKDARQQFDLVIVDTSPLLPVTDGRALVPEMDAVVLVVKWESTSREALENAFSKTPGLSDKIAGTVFNQVNPTQARYYDYYNSGYDTKYYPYYYSQSET